MRDIIPSDEDTEKFVNAIINGLHKRKEDEDLHKNGKLTYKERCKRIVSKYRNNIKEYDNKFSDNSLESLTDLHPSMSLQEKEDYQALYKYQNASIRRLREKILVSNGYYNGTCPLCEVNNVQTMDHFIPQTKYPLYSINPKNLIPSCQTCNGSKSETVLDGDKRKYWNVYLDKVPHQKFLNCTFSCENGVLMAKFYITQNDIDDDTFRLLKNTMEGQKILETYSDGSGKIISKLCSLIIEKLSTISNTTLEEQLVNIQNSYRNRQDSNKWEDVLTMGLASSDLFKKLVENELQRLYGKNGL